MAREVKKSEEAVGPNRDGVQQLKQRLRQESECGKKSAGGRLRGWWRPDPGIAPDRLEAELRAMLSHPGTRTVKSERRSSSWHGELLGCRVFVKCYRMVTVRDRIMYMFRVSRARRYWAVARVLEEAGLPTPPPLGYLEIKEGIQPVESYVITEWCDFPNGYQWLQEHRDCSDRLRREVAAALWSAMRSLYQAGVYHRDTKLTNLLVDQGDGNLRILWTDLECVRLGVRPNRHRLIRNLVQLNGSLPRWVSSEERLSFLERAAADFPELSSAATVRRIHRWTARRLEKERRTGCGP